MSLCCSHAKETCRSAACCLSVHSQARHLQRLLLLKVLVESVCRGLSRAGLVMSRPPMVPKCHLLVLFASLNYVSCCPKINILHLILLTSHLIPCSFCSGCLIAPDSRLYEGQDETIAIDWDVRVMHLHYLYEEEQAFVEVRGIRMSWIEADDGSTRVSGRTRRRKRVLLISMHASAPSRRRRGLVSTSSGTVQSARFFPFLPFPPSHCDRNTYVQPRSSISGRCRPSSSSISSASKT
jgi:hypothetical protein